MDSMMPSSSTRPNLHPVIPQQQGSLVADTPTSSTQSQTNLHNDIWSKIDISDPSWKDSESVERSAFIKRQILEQVLEPSQECVQEALQHARPSTPTRLVSVYFDHSERTSHMCLILQDNVQRARSLYRDLHNLFELDVLPVDSESNYLSQSQCDRAFDVFLKFDSLENPFPCPDSQNFPEMPSCIFKVNKQLHLELCRSRSRVHNLPRATTCSTFCSIRTVVGDAISAVTKASRALINLVVDPSRHGFLPSKIPKMEVAHLEQLFVASKGTYILHGHLETIGRLVERLYVAVEDDKVLIRTGLERGRDRQSILEVSNLLRKNNRNLATLLTDLEEHVCLCLYVNNRARSTLLEEIYAHQSF